MGESEAEEAPLLKDPVRFGGEGQSLHFCAEHGGSLFQDLGGAAVRGLEAGSAWDSSFCTHRLLARGWFLSTLGAPRGSRGSLTAMPGPAVMQARTKRH